MIIDDIMKIFLIRHGESIQNTKENYRLKLPDHKVYLTEEGKKTGQTNRRVFERIYSK